MRSVLLSVGVYYARLTLWLRECVRLEARVCASSCAWCGVDVGDERVCGPQESWQQCRTGGLADRERRCRDVA